MKTFLKKIVVFALVLLPVYIASLLILGPTGIKKMNLIALGPGNTYHRIEDIKKIDSLNVLFLGSSHAFMSFNPEILEEKGITSFNLGTMAQTATQSKFIYEKYLRHKKIDLIIMEVNPKTIRTDAQESTIDLINSTKINSEFLPMLSKSIDPIVLNSLTYTLIGPKLEAGKKTYYKGFNGGVKHNNISIDKKMKVLNRPVIDYQLESLEELVSIWKNDNQDFVLVQTPVMKAYYDSWKYNEETDSIFAGQGNYKNYNLYLNLNDTTDFSDHQHLNDKGSTTITNLIIEDFLQEF